jgi:2-haloacid dehalogenase
MGKAVIMSVDRREFLQLLGTGSTLSFLPTSWSQPLLVTQTSNQVSQAEPNPEIKALVFDAYGTLFDVYSTAVVSEQLFPGHGKELTEVWRTTRLQYMWLRSLMGRYEVFEKVTAESLVFACKKLNLDLSAEKRAQLMDAYNKLDTFPEVKEALKTLSSVPLAILSNGSPKMLQALVKRGGLEGVFTKVISVDEAKIYKPSPKAYQLTIDAFKVKTRSEIGFVSSNGWDAIGATSFGLTTFWINRGDAPMEELGLKPTRILHKLTDLVDVVKQSQATTGGSKAGMN